MNKPLKIMAISDTHEDMHILRDIAKKQQGDIFIHGGDFTFYGQQKYFREFFDILDTLKFKHKIVISGNHQISLDNGCIEPNHKEQYLKKYRCKMTKQQIVNKLKKRCHYLEHQSIQIEGIRIFGSPYTTMYCGSAFQYDLKFQQDIWSQVPENVDILLTHMPPFGILDQNSKKIKAGSLALRNISLKRQPKFHIFGHIHQAKGNIKHQNIIFLNVACNPLIFYYQR